MSSAGLTTTSGSNTFDTLASYTIPAGTLATNGDTLEIFAIFSVASDGLGLVIAFNGNAISLAGAAYDYYVHIRLVRISNTEIIVEQGSASAGISISSLNLTTTGYLIDIQVADSVAGTAMLHAFNIMRYQA